MTELTIPQRWTAGYIKTSDVGGFVSYGDYLTAVEEAYEQGKKDATEWQPIESAPKNGSLVLVAGKMLAFERTTLLDGKTLRQELEDRGYDITTLKFRVMKKVSNENS